MSNNHHRYSNSADVPASLRTWFPQKEQDGTERILETRPMPPIPSSPAHSYAQPPSTGQQGQWPIYSPNTRAAIGDSQRSYRRSADSTPLAASQEYRANMGSQRQRQYNSQDYAQVTPSSPSQSSRFARPAGQGVSGYQAYNPARYQDQVGGTSSYVSYSPQESMSSQGFRPVNPYNLPLLPPPPPIMSHAETTLQQQQQYYAQQKVTTDPDTNSRTPHQDYLRHDTQNTFLQDHSPLPNSRISSSAVPTLQNRYSSGSRTHSQASSLSQSASLRKSGAPPVPPKSYDVGIASYGPSFDGTDNLIDSRYNSPMEGTSPVRGQPGLERSRTTGKHPHSRPLPGPPPDNTFSMTEAPASLEDEYDSQAEELAQAELYEQVEHAMRLSGKSPSHMLPSWNDNDRQIDSDGKPPTSFQVFNGDRHPGSRTLSVSAQVIDFDDQDDAEAAAGIAAMRAAEEEEAAETLWRTRSQLGKSAGSSIGYGSGDYHSNHSYRNSTAMPFTSPGAATESYRQSTDLHPSRSAASSGGSYTRSTGGQPIIRNSSGASMLSFAGSIGQGYIDQAGTGGFQDNATDHRLSFDEGDERGYLEDQAFSGTDFGDVSPRRSNTRLNRPLPPPPEGVSPFVDNGHEWDVPNMDVPLGFPFPAATPILPPAVQTHNLNTGVPRSISLLSPRNQVTNLPDRAKTDADERRKQNMRTASLDLFSSGLDVAQARSVMSRSVTDLSLDLPILPAGRRFQPSKLTYREFDRCDEPWALSSLTSWLRSITDGESELREQALVLALVALFTHKVPNIHIAEAEDLAAKVLTSLEAASILIREEELLPVRLGRGDINGLLFQLTSGGCYAPSLHQHDVRGKCYAHLCQRTVKRINMEEQTAERNVDWATFHKVKKEDVEELSKIEIERQNILHEIVTSEYTYLDDLNLLRTIYREGIQKAKPPIMSPQRLEVFLPKVFGKVSAVQHANQEFLLPQLRYRQQEQGPWIVGFSDIFRDWIRKAKVAYIEYAAGFPVASLEMKQEEQKNGMFSAFLETARNDKRSRRLGWDNFLKAPITRLQRYGLLLQTVLKNMPENAGPEVTNLQLAIDEIRDVTKECDTIVAVQGRKAELVELNSRLVLREEMKKHVELNLESKGRELLLKGDLQRMGANKFSWLETHAILLDNYLILAKSESHRLTGTSKNQTYDVSKIVSQSACPSFDANIWM